MNIPDLPFPAYVLEEKRLRQNLEKIRQVRDAAGVEILVAFKAFAMWKSFPVFRAYGFSGSTASSINEARLAFEEMGSLTHSYSPAYTEENFHLFLKYSKSISFNSFSQFEHFYPQVRACSSRAITCGIRINPEYSDVETDLYNPCAAGSRLGVSIDEMPEKLPEGIDGFHFHTLCESDSYALEKTLAVVEEKFAAYFPRISWLNMGGGHLITREDYNAGHLINLLKRFRQKYPHIRLLMEPGSAFTWQTGALYAHVVDIVRNRGVQTAVLDVSFACHMPDCLEMPYKPRVRFAGEPGEKTFPYTYRLGGNSCLSGDFIGDWTFPEALKIGDPVIFEDMIHYTTVKTHSFNGIPHPAICCLKEDGNLEIWRTFDYSDYKNRMD